MSGEGALPCMWNSRLADHLGFYPSLAHTRKALQLFQRVDKLAMTLAPSCFWSFRTRRRMLSQDRPIGDPRSPHPTVGAAVVSAQFRVHHPSATRRRTGHSTVAKLCLCQAGQWCSAMLDVPSTLSLPILDSCGSFAAARKGKIRRQSHSVRCKTRGGVTLRRLQTERPFAPSILHRRVPIHPRFEFDTADQAIRGADCFAVVDRQTNYAAAKPAIPSRNLEGSACIVAGAWPQPGPAGPPTA